MFKRLRALALCLAFLSFAMPAEAATGQQCNIIDGQVTAGGVIFEANWCGPSEAAVGSNFQIYAQVQLSVAGLTLNLPAANTWTYVGCSYVSDTTGGGVLTASAVVLVSMDSETCTVSTTAGVLALFGQALGNYPLLWAIYDPTADLPTDFTTETDLDITSWPTLDATLSGGLDLDITSWPDLDVYVQEWPELFASVDIDSWPTLLASISGTLDVDAVVSGDLDLDITSWPDLNVYLQEWPELFASVEITSWPVLFSSLSGTVHVTGVDIGDVNTTIENFTNEAQPSNLQEATGLDGLDWLALVVILLACIVIWHKTKDHVFINVMGVLCIVVGIALLLVYSIVGLPILLGLALLSCVVGGYMIVIRAIEHLAEV